MGSLARAAPDRRSARRRLAPRAGAEYKRRIKDLVRQLLPISSLTLYAGHPAVAFADLAAVGRHRGRLVRAVRAELA